MRDGLPLECSGRRVALESCVRPAVHGVHFRVLSRAISVVAHESVLVMRSVSGACRRAAHVCSVVVALVLLVLLVMVALPK